MSYSRSGTKRQFYDWSKERKESTERVTGTDSSSYATHKITAKNTTINIQTGTRRARIFRLHAPYINSPDLHKLIIKIAWAWACDRLAGRWVTIDCEWVLGTCRTTNRAVCPESLGHDRLWMGAWYMPYYTASLNRAVCPERQVGDCEGTHTVVYGITRVKLRPRWRNSSSKLMYAWCVRLLAWNLGTKDGWAISRRCVCVCVCVCIYIYGCTCECWSYIMSYVCVSVCMWAYWLCCLR
jgi:hypothetical protein